MFVNVIGDYRRRYLKDRKNGVDPESAHIHALESVYISLLHASAVNKQPVSDLDLDHVNELMSSSHYTQLLEEMLTMPEEEQKSHLKKVAKIPLLSLVK